MQGSGSGGVVVDLAETNIWMHPRSSGDVSESFAARRVSAAIVVDDSGRLRFGADSASDAEQCVLGVLGRLGDPVPLLVGERLVPAALLVAGQIDAALAALDDEPGGGTAGVTIIHPDHVRAGDIAEVFEHLDHRGPIRWISRGRLVAETLSASGPVGVVHIGSTTAEVGLWSEAPSRLLSPPVTRRGSAGRLVDELIARAVMDSGAGGVVVTDPAEAKHALAHETAVDVSVGDVSVRVVRDDLRTMVSQVVGPVIETLEICLRRGRVSRGDLQRIVLIGGSASLPGLVEQISSWCDAPVSVEPRVGRLVAILDDRETAESQPFLVTAREPAATTPGPTFAGAHPAQPGVTRGGAADRVRSALVRGRRRGLHPEPRVRLSRRTGVAALASLALLGVASVSGAAPVMSSARLVMEVFAAADDGGLTAEGREYAVAEVSRVALQALPISEENRERIVETLPPIFIAIPRDDQPLDEEGADGAKPWQTPSADGPDVADENRPATPFRTTGPKTDKSRKPATSPASSKSTSRPSAPGKPSKSPPSNSNKPPISTPVKTTPSGPPSSSPGPVTPDPVPPPAPTSEPPPPPAPEPTSDPPPAPEPTSEPPPAPPSDPPADEPTSDPGDTGTP